MFRKNKIHFLNEVQLEHIWQNNIKKKKKHYFEKMAPIILLFVVDQEPSTSLLDSRKVVWT
jgi:hypothetical protein